MRAVVIGGNGFIGSHIVDALLASRWQVAVYDHSPERYRPPSTDVEYVIGELGNRGLLAAALPAADVVFHLASTTLPQSSNESPEFDIRSNLIDSVRFLEACVESRVGKVVFVSSGGTVYGIPSSPLVREGHSTSPICSYGIIKLAIEKYLHLFKHLFGLSYAILRPSNAYGQRQNPSSSQGAVAVFLGRAARGLPIQIWGDGEIVRDFIHVSDLAAAGLAAATSSEGSHPIFNVGSGQGTSLNQLLETMENVVQKPLQVQRLPGRSFDVARIGLDIEKARTELAWTPKISMEQGILDTWNWVRTLY